LSVVIAYKKDGVIYFGADTQVSFGDYKLTIGPSEPQKIICMPNDIIMGFTGKVDLMSILIKMHSYFDPFATEELTKDSILNHIINPFTKKLIQEKRIVMTSGTHDFEISMLIGKKDALFHIDSDGQVTKLSKFGSIGSGSLPSHTLLKHEKGHPQDIIRKALEISSHYDQYVSKPFIYINTKTHTVERDV
jgi:ATP-dependent protease HslVU (ClpYQ) peptidase subunit